MRTTLVIIHGGNTFDTRAAYLKYLKTRDVLVSNFRPRSDWKDTAARKFAKKFEVLVPQMPSKANARYEEWKIWFERMLPLVRGNAVMVGHSLGGIFLAKYLSEHKLKNKLRALILVAAPFDDTDGETLVDFQLPHSLKKCATQAKEIFLFHSSDDPVVSYVHAQKYLAAIPLAKLFTFHDRGHFNMENFPEMFRLIQGLLRT